MRAVAAAIRSAVDHHLPDHIGVIAEPGRYLVADSAVVISSVIGRETRDGAEWLYLDTGIFQMLMETLEFGRLLPEIVAPQTAPQTPRARFTVAGPTCDGDDVLGHGIELPAGIGTGDRLVITNAGAYTLAYGSTFNGIAPPRILAVPGLTRTGAVHPARVEPAVRH